MSSAATLSPLAAAPPPVARRPRVLLIGAAFGSVASGLVVLSMLAAYLQLRAQRIGIGVTALPDGVVLPLTPGNMGMVTLLMSAVTMAWIVHALKVGDRVHAYIGLGVTVLLGAAFINSTAYLYQELAMGFTASGTAGMLYAVTGAHLVMVFVGLIFTAVMGFQALGGQLTGRDAGGMSAAALYWYVTIAVFVAVWYGIYITK